MRYGITLLLLPLCAAQTLSPTSPISKLAIDASGNIYAAQGAAITKLNQWTSALPFPVLTMNAGTNLVAAGAGSIAILDPGTGNVLSSGPLPVPGGAVPLFMAVTPSGNIVLSGYTVGAAATPGAIAIPPPNQEAFLMKLDPQGNLLWIATGIGGPVTADSRENIYVAGSDDNGPFPTTAGALQPSGSISICATTGGLIGFGFPCPQQYVAKVSPDGSTLLFATYLTGQLGAFARDIALGPDGSIYTAGSVQATDYPVTSNALIPVFPAQFVDTLCSCIIPVVGYASSGFLSRLSPDGSTLLYSTFLGGSQVDSVSSIAVGPDGSVTLAGTAGSPDFPGLPQQLANCQPGNSMLISKQRDFLMRISADGSTINSARLIGGTDPGIACITDAADGSFADTVSPGELITINGFGVGPDASDAPGIGNPGMQIGGVSVTFDGIPSSLTAAGGAIVTAAVPFAVAGRQQTTLTLLHDGQPFDSRTLTLAPAKPSMFVVPPNGKTCNAGPQVLGSFVGGSPTPAPLILNADGTINACDNPAAFGSTVTLFMNGLGAGPPRLMVGNETVSPNPLGSQTAVSAVSFQLPAGGANPLFLFIEDGTSIVPDYQPGYGIPVYAK